MIDELRVRNLGVIAEADLGFSPGLTAITGETGAGKTMLLTSLGLLLGEASQANKVRSGTDRALVDGTFLVPAPSRAADRIRQAGGDVDVEGDEEILELSRQVPARGRSRAYAGGRSVPRGLLADVGADLVTIHGQAEQMKLKSPAAQRRMVDAAGGEEADRALARYRAAYQRREQALAAIAEWEASAKRGAERRLALTALVEAVDEVKPTAGEEDRLKDKIDYLDRAEEIRAMLLTALGALSGDEAMMGAADLTGRAVRMLEPATDERISAAAHRLDGISAELTDIVGELSGLLAELDGGENLDELHARRAQLIELSRTLAMPVDEAIEAAERARAELSGLADPQARREELGGLLDAAQEELGKAADLLHEARRATANRLAEGITEELAHLALGRAQVRIEVTRREPSPDGGDDITFLLLPDAHSPATALATSASGGELSRIMLAIELVTSRDRPDHRTFIFDEVDAGIGGEAAKAVGQRLAALARHSQVIVVTHLAQVACWADRQIVVARGENATEVSSVGEDDRVTELARMLSGSADLDSARRHAADLLDAASVGR
ncbi:MAG: DNA repair protein RecN [Flaviflexus sp.]|nr:DNA repair protein RecN [Flaviflexus sp.]